MSTKKAVSILGLGEMGTALSSAFVSNGYPATVWNRTASKASDLVAQGATLAESPAACISAAADLVIICLVTNAAVRQVLSPDVLKSTTGKTVVNLTNGTQSQAKAIAELVVPYGAEYIDGGIMAVPQMIGTPASFILYSGSKTGIDRVEPDLSILGKVTFVSEDDVGKASLLDNALLSGMYGMFGGAFQAIAMARAGGMKATPFATELLIPWLNGMTAFVEELAKGMDEGAETGVYPSQGATLGMQVAGAANFTGSAREAGVWDGILSPFLGIMKRRVEQGGEKEGLSALINEMSLEKN